MTVYLYCEGITDYAVIPHFMKLVSGIHDLDIQWIKRDKLEEFTTHRKYTKMTYNYKYIKALATISLLKGCKKIAYHQDADNHYSDRYNEMIADFNDLIKIGFRCLAIVPKEAIESWLLADEKAYPSVPNNPKLPFKPEELWGNSKDKDSNHPYSYFVRVLAQFKLADNRDSYVQIAENTDINILKTRCPESFGQFYTDMQSFIIQENTP